MSDKEAACPYCGKVSPVDGAWSQGRSEDGRTTCYAAGCDHCGVIGPEAPTADEAARLWVLWCERVAQVATEPLS